MIEIERKFLVNNNSFLDNFSHSNRIVQGYLSSQPERTVRVRIKGEKGYLTIKGKSEGFSRYEWEKEIAIEDAEKLLALCEPSVIDKIRYEIILRINESFDIDRVLKETPDSHFDVAIQYFKLIENKGLLASFDYTANNLKACIEQIE